MNQRSLQKEGSFHNNNMHSVSWLTSAECLPSSAITAPPFSLLNAVQWLRFLFLSACPQRVLFSFTNLLLLLTLLVLYLLQRRFIKTDLSNPLIEEPNESKARVSVWFDLSAVFTALQAICFTGMFICALIQGDQSEPWRIIETVFRLVQALTYVSILLLIVREKKQYPSVIRIYWIAHFLLVVLLSTSAIARFGEDQIDPSLKVDDYVFLASIPISMFLFIVAVKGSSRSQTDPDPDPVDSNLTGYATASILSRATWAWLNPLISRGYRNPLAIYEVPSLSYEHRAEKLEELFERNWPKPNEDCKNPVRVTLMRCFWKQVVFTGFLAVVKLAVAFVAPVLIQDFVSFANGKRRDQQPLEGYYLTAILLVSKTIEVLGSHHFNFHSQKLGMLIRSTLMTALYKKGLKLSCSSRQEHGIGQIVNYMAVDAQQLSDLMGQLHVLWATPLQMVVALGLLYYYFGISMFVALLIVLAALTFVMVRTRQTNTYIFSLMKNRDSRLKATTEMLSNMRVIKFQAWEEHFKKRIESVREKEFGWLSSTTYAFASNMIVFSSMPAFMAVILFAVSLWLGYSLDPGTVFTATTVIKMVEEPVRTFPQALVSFSQAFISFKRLDVFLTSQELDDGTVERGEGCDDGGMAVQVSNGTFAWDDEGDEAVLKGVNLRIKKGEIAAVVGTVGSGKSSLLASVLGELHKKSGNVRVCGTTAYVAQSSWIQNATIEENILFGSSMDRQRYKEVLRVCCLVKDLEILENGDQTEIGERGINLSGGQKQRIQLARAVYQNRDIYLLDDIFSAVDAHTGSEIFKECVRGVLKDKTVILVTHQVDFLYNADLILVMRDGMIVQSGKYHQLLESGKDFSSLVAAYDSSMELVGKNATTENPAEAGTLKSSSSSSKGLERSGSVKESGSKLIKEEEREVGHVNAEVYKEYCTEAYGWWGVAAVVAVSLLWQGSFVGSDYWLATETNAKTGNTDSFSPSLFIGVYTIIAIISCGLVLVKGVLVAFLGLKTAQKFFDQTLHSILHAPMSFFDTTPSGRILTRASSDQSNIDFIIPMFLSLAIAMYFSFLSIVAVTCMNAWPITVLVIPLVWLNIWYRGYYIATSRELSRLDSITKAPVIHHFSETIEGVMTIRCFKKQSDFFGKNADRVNANVRMDFHNNASNEWFGFRMEFIGSIFLCISALLMVSLPSSFIQPEYVGLALSYGLSLNGVMFFAVYVTCGVEKYMVAVERIKQFIRIPSEPEWYRPDYLLPSQDWPVRGDIEIKNLKVRYRENTPLVLKGVMVSIKGGEKVGIVGRTGSGKSTLVQVFFRLVEPSSGTIILDGVDICKLGLHDLRSRLGIIPQDPVLFEGTVRSNIDPLELYSDDEIWKSLERCQLKEVVAAKAEKLDAPVVGSGDNWSMGQRQLLCLGRIMLKSSKLLFMDEATASVDSKTDSIIQKIIREDFTSCTIISIAHRIPTVMDCDKVLVMEAGMAKEFDKPNRLLETGSLFGSLVQEYANRSEM